MKNLAEANVDVVMNGNCVLTGLRLFMVAAMDNCHDLSGVYGLMRMGPENVWPDG